MVIKKFDCIIAGAGCAGATLAKKLSEAGLSIALLDKKARKEIGHPWEVAIEKSVFGRTSLRFPPKGVWEESPDISRYYAGDLKNFVEVDSVDDDGFFINHKTFNQYLLKQALSAGVYLLPEHNVNELYIKNNFTRGVKGTRKSLFGEKPFFYKGNVIVDASGIAAVLRKQAPPSFLIKRNIRSQDFAYAWNEIREVNAAQMDQLFEKFGLSPGMLYTRIGKYHAYEVFHLRKNRTVNLIFGSAFSRENEKAVDVAQGFIERNPFFGPRITGGGSLIPLRRSIDSMADNGFLCLGDSACQVIPTMGSGVASSMHAADIAARTIIEACNRNNFSRELLWKYNAKYQTKRGAILASYDIIRRFLQSMTAETIDDVFKAGLLTNENFISTFTSNTITYDIGQILDKIQRIFSHRGLIPTGIKFVQTMRDSQKALNIYKNFPQTFNKESFKNWVKATNELFKIYSTIG